MTTIEEIVSKEKIDKYKEVLQIIMKIMGIVIMYREVKYRTKNG